MGHDAAQTVAMVGGDQTEAVLMVGNLVVKGGTPHTTYHTTNNNTTVRSRFCLSVTTTTAD